MARLAAAQARVGTARTATERFDAGFGLQQAQRGVERAQAAMRPQSFGGKLMGAVMSSRVGIGGKGGLQLMPLVSKILPLVGKFAGPIGLVLMALDGLRAVGQAAIESAGRLSALGEAARQSGGSTGQVSQLGRFGVNAGNATDRGERLQQLLESDPQAQITAAKMGVRTRPGPYADPNRLNNLPGVLEGLEKIKDPTQRLAAARKLEVAWALRYLDASRNVREGLKADGRIAARVRDPRAAKAANDFSIGLERIQGNFSMLSDVIFGAHMPRMGRIANELANGVQRSVRWMSILSRLSTNSPLLRMFDKGVSLWERTGAALDRGLDRVDALMERMGLGDKGSPQNAQTAATNRNTQALMGLNQALQQGLFGGGARAQAFTSRAWRGYYANRALEAGQLRMGPFGL
jgi:hypothetical protein